MIRRDKELRLNRETVRELDRAELDDDRLREVAGGVLITQDCAITYNCVVNITAKDCSGNYTMNVLCY